MKLTLKEIKLVLLWFDVASECNNLNEKDLKLYDKLREYLELEDDEDDPLAYPPRKNKSIASYSSDEDDEDEFNINSYSDEDDDLGEEDF